jgi:hypothetical protein
MTPALAYFALAFTYRGYPFGGHGRRRARE